MRASRERASEGGCSSLFSFEDDVVDEAGGADADSAGEGGRVEVGDLDVVDVEPVRLPQGLQRRVADRASPGRAAVRARSRAPPARAGRCATRARARRHRERSGRRCSSTSRREVADQSCRITSTCCASFWPKYATSGRTIAKSLSTRSRRRGSGPGGAPLEDRAELGRRRPTSGSPVGTSRRPTARTRCRRPRPRATREVAILVARIARRDRRASPNCAGLTKRLMTTVSHSRARRAQQRQVAVVERAHRRHEPDRAGAPRRERFADLARSCGRHLTRAPRPGSLMRA